jgi:hypothetical protein
MTTVIVAIDPMMPMSVRAEVAAHVRETVAAGLHCAPGDVEVQLQLRSNASSRESFAARRAARMGARQPA